MPRPSQETAILDAALHCFAERGYDATRIRHIAEAANVSDGALYRHYPSKEAIARALFERHMRAYVGQLQEVAAREASVQQRLQAIVHISLAAYRANPDAIHYILLEHPQLMDTMPTDFVYPLQVITGLMEEGQRQGNIRAGLPILLAAIFLGCLLRPIIVARSEAQHGLDLLHDPLHEPVIADAAWAAVARPSDIERASST